MTEPSPPVIPLVYADNTYANTYHSTRGNVLWASQNEQQKYGALLYASEYLDSHFVWFSTILDEAQHLNWPRNTYYDSQGREVSGIPDAIKRATCELALEHINSGLNDTYREGIKSESFGDASTTYTTSSRSFSKIKIALKEYGNSGGLQSNTLWRS